jgi:ferrous iron transport protein A
MRVLYTSEIDTVTTPLTNASLRHVIPLRLLPAGSTATIVEVDGKPDVVSRLHEMGVRPGCDVRMVRQGTACIVAIDNHRFGFRGADAAHVLVEVGGSDPV